ncbi:haloacid dehalogenase type II [Roseospira marina]|uniref:(S)-2-haloacid dehalogenase n=1 Tax=Roseospira marina TaxID=140057 RepID=A0A5M6IF03_9PROT|nr:haloacid dehalogenase type II [Roseospira marina]KAA5606712.1 haloacid dehalogenase type II [Roseospira marina]MBB4313873.1 2-haloacid dehalogenase [Roseospira marina]MBB5087035.1 2-haloacid dehalogenase [Roseospira marina]
MSTPPWPAAPPGPIVACLFDAYGTLFDITSAARRLKDEIGPAWESVAEIWRTRQLEYTWLRSLMDRYTDFRVITAEALDYAFAAVGQVPAPGLTDRLMDVYMTLDAYPEVPGMLATLRDKGVGTAILSNGAPDMLQAATDSAGLAGVLDDLLSVDTVGVFKPAPAAYELGCVRFGCEAGRLMFVSSNGWDVAGAATFGFRTVWVNRRNAPAERLPGVPMAELDSLDGLPDLVSDPAFR